jgi:hypothetical protein
MKEAAEGGMTGNDSLSNVDSLSTNNSNLEPASVNDASTNVASANDISFDDAKTSMLAKEATNAKEKTVWSFLSEIAQDESPDERRGTTLEDGETAFTTQKDKNGEKAKNESPAKKTEESPTEKTVARSEDREDMQGVESQMHHDTRPKMEPNHETVKSDPSEVVVKQENPDTEEPPKDKVSIKQESPVKIKEETDLPGGFKQEHTATEETGQKSEDTVVVSVLCDPDDVTPIPANFVGPLIPEDPPKIAGPDVTTFELVADSIDALKELIRRLRREPDWEPEVRDIVVDDDDDEKVNSMIRRTILRNNIGN